MDTAATSPRARSRWSGLAWGVMFASGTAWLVTGCVATGEDPAQRELADLRTRNQQQSQQLVAQQATITELHSQLRVARSITEDDLRRVFYPEEIVIDRLTGGANYDGQPGDDGVTVYLRPIDRDGDVVKVAGDIRIQLYDLAAPGGQLLGEYFIPVDECGKYWHGKLLTGHYTIRCPWPAAPPANPEVTVRVTFVDYLTKRVVSAQSVCRVQLPPAP